jgi:hypothetical protein
MRLYLLISLLLVCLMPGLAGCSSQISEESAVIEEEDDSGTTPKETE